MINDLRQILNNSAGNLAIDVLGVAAIGLTMMVMLHIPVFA